MALGVSNALIHYSHSTMYLILQAILTNLSQYPQPPSRSSLPSLVPLAHAPPRHFRIYALTVPPEVASAAASASCLLPSFEL